MDEKMKEVMKGIYENLTDEQKEKAKQCKTTDELMTLAGEWGIELPDEALDAVSGGCSSSCSDCGEDCGSYFFICPIDK